MQKTTQNPSQPIGQRRRIAVVGGGRPGLETLALLAEDPETEVVCLWDPDRAALIFRLDELGFNFSDHIKPKLLDDFRELEGVMPLDLIIESSSNSQLRRNLDPFLERGIPVISAQAAQLLWGFRLGKEVGLGQDLGGLKTFLEGIDLLHDRTEFFEIFLRLGLLMTHAGAASLYISRPDEHEPFLIYSATRFPASLSAVGGSGGGSAGLSHSPIMSTDPVLVQKAVGFKRPIFIPEENQSSSGEQERAPLKGVNEIPTLILPIMLDEEPVGILLLRRIASSGAFTPKDLEACSRLGGVTAKYLRKFLNLQEMQEISLSETMRTELKAILNSQLSLEEKLAKGVKKIREVLGGGHAHIYVKERSSNDLILQASTTQASQVSGMLRVRVGDGFVGEVAKNRQPIILKGGALSFSPGNERALLYLPLNAAGGMCGVLCIEQLSVGLGIKKTLKLLEEVGEAFAQVISGDLEHRRMSQKLLRLSAVQEEGFDLLSETDRERLTIMITSSVAMLVDAEAVILRVLEKKGKRLLVASTHGLHKNEIDSRLVQMDGLSALKTFQGRSAQVMEDLRKMDQTLPQKFQYLSGICLPLVYEGVTLGTLSVYNKLAFQTFGCTAFDQDDMEILDKFSYYVGKALINAQEAQARSTLITIDEVTGLRNERYLMLRLPEELRRAERYQRSLSLMIFEVKSEAKIQPAEGSSTEKEFIKQVAEVLQETFRNVDILVRVKGTQFAILMPDTGETVTDATARLARSLASLPLKIFIGYSTYPTEAKTVQDLIGKASKLSGMVRDI